MPPDAGQALVTHLSRTFHAPFTRFNRGFFLFAAALAFREAAASTAFASFTPPRRLIFAATALNPG
jgi:hypothetical protein